MTLYSDPYEFIERTAMRQIMAETQIQCKSAGPHLLLYYNLLATCVHLR